MIGHRQKNVDSLDGGRALLFPVLLTQPSGHQLVEFHPARRFVTRGLVIGRSDKNTAHRGTQVQGTSLHSHAPRECLSPIYAGTVRPHPQRVHAYVGTKYCGGRVRFHATPN